MPRIVWHSLRHASASLLIAAGVDVATVARRLGHADPGVTLRVYSKMFAKDDSAAAAAIDRRRARRLAATAVRPGAVTPGPT